MDDKTLTKLLKQGFAEQDARFGAILVRGFSEQESRLKAYIDQGFADQSRDLRDYLDNRLTASNKSLKQEILDGVGEMFDGLSPQFNNHERRILKLEKLVHA